MLIARPLTAFPDDEREVGEAAEEGGLVEVVIEDVAEGVVGEDAEDDDMLGVGGGRASICSDSL